MDLLRNIQNKQPISILIADPHRIVQRGLEEFIDQEPSMTVVGMTQNGHEAFDMIVELKPDIVVLDIKLDNLSGIELMKMCNVHQQVTRAEIPKFLIFTSYLDKHYVWGFLSAGAKGYLHKGEPIEVVLDGITKLFEGKTILSEEVQVELLKIVSSINHDLTTREISILKLVAKGVPNHEIASALDLSIGTVRVNLQRIYNKLPLVDNRAGAVAWAWVNRIVQ